MEAKLFLLWLWESLLLHFCAPAVHRSLPRMELTILVMFLLQSSLDLGKVGQGPGLDVWDLCSWVAAHSSQPSLAQLSMLWQPETAPGSSRGGGEKKCCKFQINCKFNDCVHEYLITHISHEYA